jgi:hypothetical protein
MPAAGSAWRVCRSWQIGEQHRHPNRPVAVACDADSNLIETGLEQIPAVRRAGPKRSMGVSHVDRVGEVFAGFEGGREDFDDARARSAITRIVSYATQRTHRLSVAPRRSVEQRIACERRQSFAGARRVQHPKQGLARICG